MQNLSLKNELHQKLTDLIKNNQDDLNNIKKVAIDKAWEILQLATAEIIQNIQIYYPEYTGKDKKNIAMDCLTIFYDSVFSIINIPFVPAFLNPIIHKYVKAILMIMVSSSIDAMVTIFKQAGVFQKKEVIDG